MISNGVDTARFAPYPDVAAVRRELGIGPTDPVVGIVAALRPEKNHELFLEMARRVVDEIADRAVPGHRRWPVPRQRFEQRARELDISEPTF